MDNNDNVTFPIFYSYTVVTRIARLGVDDNVKPGLPLPLGQARWHACQNSSPYPPQLEWIAYILVGTFLIQMFHILTGCGARKVQNYG
jgi:hypothetical protein